MNNSIPSMNPLCRSILSQGVSYTEKYTLEGVIGGSLNGVEFQKITHLSGLAPVARISDQVGRSGLKNELPNPVAIQFGRIRLNEASNPVPIDESEDEEFFDDEADGINREIEVGFLKQEGSVEKEEVSVRTNGVILNENRKKNNVSRLRSRIVNPEKINRVRDNFAGDLAIRFVSENKYNMLKISGLTRCATLLTN